jgi:cation transport protein ChaC
VTERIELTRDNIRSGALGAMLRARGDTLLLSEEELSASRARFLARRPAGDLWVFGYGSLIWNPAFDHVERRVARVAGFSRRYCLWSYLGRGSRDCPGLMLGLEAGGACQGVAFRIAEDAIDSELDVLWRREMLSGAYRPVWVWLNSAGGRFPALTFAINRQHERYAGRLTLDQVAERIAIAGGPLGTCVEYLENTHQQLRALGIADRYLDGVMAAVSTLRASTQPNSLSTSA